MKVKRLYIILMLSVAAMLLGAASFAFSSMASAPATRRCGLSAASDFSPKLDAAASDDWLSNDMDDDDDGDGTDLNSGSECLPLGAGTQTLDESRVADSGVYAFFPAVPPASPCRGFALRRRIFKKSW